MAKPTKKPVPAAELREETSARRLRAKLEAAQLKAALSYYAAADKGRRNRDWRGSPVSADAAIIPDSETLIGRARVAVANTWIGRAALRAQKRNVVGRGIMVVPVAKNADGAELSDVNRRTGDLFMRWASDKTFCDIERRRTFWQIQRVAIAEEFVTGETFIVWNYIPNPRNVGLKLQMFEAEQLDRSIQSCGNNQVRGGVEVDEYGGAVAYHFYERNPNDYLIQSNWKSIRVDASRVLHYFDAERVLQSRGVSHLAAVLQDVRDFSAFKDATLMRARMEACIGMVIKRNLPSPAGSPLTLPYASGDTGSTASGMKTTDFAPGMVPELLPGEDVVPFTPQSPGNQYDPFTTITLRGIGAGMGMSFGALTRHNDANYSAARQDMLEDEREIGPQQDALIDHLIMPIYELWYRFAVLEGRIEGVVDSEFLGDPDRFVEAEYIAPARPWIDPEKEANAFAKAIELRIITRKEIVAQRGGRFQNLLKQIATEKKEAAAEGLAFPEDIEQAASQAKAAPPQMEAPAGAPPAEAVATEPDGGEQEGNDGSGNGGEDDGGDSSGDGSDDAALANARLDWITINGSHVFIDDDGTISKGPPEFVGRTPGEIKSGGASKKSGKSPRKASDSVAERRTKTIAASTPATGGEFYHGTSVSNVSSIMKSGIKPTDKTLGFPAAFVGSSFNLAASYGAGRADSKGDKQFAIVVVKPGRDSGMYHPNGEKSSIFKPGTINPSDIDRIEIYNVSDTKNAKPVRVIKGKASASIRLPRTVTLAQADASNYRPSNDPVVRCSTCSHAVGTYCKLYDFTFIPTNTCDSWEAEPLNEDDGGKILPPGPQNGERGIDRDFQPAASIVPPL